MFVAKCAAFIYCISIDAPEVPDMQSDVESIVYGSYACFIVNVFEL